MAADEQPQVCGAVNELDYGIWFECELLPGHAGDHQILHTWQNEPHGPKPPPTPPKSRLLPNNWADALEEALVRSLTQAIELGALVMPYGPTPRSRPVRPSTSARELT
jgi:hypothetical protein